MFDLKWFKGLFKIPHRDNHDGYQPRTSTLGDPPTSRIFNDPVTWGETTKDKMEAPGPWPDPPDLPPKKILNEDVWLPKGEYARSMLPSKPPKQEKKPYYRVDCLDLGGSNLKSFYQPTEYELMLDAWSTLDEYYRVTMEYMTEEEFDNLPDYEG